MKKQKRFTEEEKEWIRKSFSSGQYNGWIRFQKDFADNFGYTRSVRSLNGFAWSDGLRGFTRRKIVWSDKEIEIVRNGYKNNFSLKEIEEKLFFKRSAKAICAIAKNLGITTPTENETAGPLIDLQMSVLVGLMLGDGSLINQNKNAYLKVERSVVDKDYSIFTYNLFSNYIDSDIKNYHRYDVRTNKIYESVAFNTRSDSTFTSLYNKWYLQVGDRIIKIIPKDDIALNNITLATWFFDDGYFRCHRLGYGSEKSKNNRIRFATHSFSKEECIFLKNAIDSLCDLKKNGTKIYETSWNKTLDRPSFVIEVNDKESIYRVLKIIQSGVLESGIPPMKRKSPWEHTDFDSYFLCSRSNSNNKDSMRA